MVYVDFASNSLHFYFDGKFKKILLFIYFSSIIFVDLKFFDLYKEYLTAAQFLISLIVIKYFYQFLTQNKYYRVKSKPILLAIAGDSGVGKSTISEILYSFLESITQQK